MKHNIARVIGAILLEFTAIPAQAHLVQTGFGNFYDGIVHVAVTPEDLLIVLALALFAGQRGTLCPVHIASGMADWRHPQRVLDTYCEPAAADHRYLCPHRRIGGIESSGCQMPLSS